MNAHVAKKPNPVDVYVGGRIKLRRNMLGLSQEKLGDALGVTFQQVQKYEKGTNRVGSSRMQAITKILQTPVEFFFEGAPEVSDSGKGAEITNVVDADTAEHLAFLGTNEGVKLNREFNRIKDQKVRSKAVELIKAMADAEI